jgi:uncharacterized Tic20 family protein
MTESNDNLPPPPAPDPAAPVPPPPGAAGAAPGEPLPYQNPGTPTGGGVLPYSGPAATQDDKTMAMLAHLGGILFGFLAPLIVWLIKKDQSPFVEDQAKEALNFQITLMIGYVIGGATTMVCIGFVILPVVWLVGLIFGIIGSMAAYKGEAYRYPFNIRLIK